MSTIADRLLGKKVRNTRIIPVELKIVIIFTLFMLASNFVSNYINLSYNRAELVKQMKEILVKELKVLYNFANTQREILQLQSQHRGNGRDDRGESAAGSTRRTLSCHGYSRHRQLLLCGRRRSTV